MQPYITSNISGVSGGMYTASHPSVPDRFVPRGLSSFRDSAVMKTHTNASDENAIYIKAVCFFPLGFEGLKEGTLLYTYHGDKQFYKDVGLNNHQIIQQRDACITFTHDQLVNWKLTTSQLEMIKSGKIKSIFEFFKPLGFAFVTNEKEYYKHGLYVKGLSICIFGRIKVQNIWGHDVINSSGLYIMDSLKHFMNKKYETLFNEYDTEVKKFEIEVKKIDTELNKKYDDAKYLKMIYDSIATNMKIYLPTKDFDNWNAYIKKKNYIQDVEVKLIGEYTQIENDSKLLSDLKSEQVYKDYIKKKKNPKSKFSQKDYNKMRLERIKVYLNEIKLSSYMFSDKTRTPKGFEKLFKNLTKNVVKVIATKIAEMKNGADKSKDKLDLVMHRLAEMKKADITKKAEYLSSLKGTAGIDWDSPFTDEFPDGIMKALKSNDSEYDSRDRCTLYHYIGQSHEKHMRSEYVDIIADIPSHCR